MGPMIDFTSFKTVRRVVSHPSSPITDVIVVTNDTLLQQLADFLIGSSLSQNDKVRLQTWLEAGRMKIGGWVDAPSPACDGFIDLQRIPDDADCRVVFLPPFYLVHRLN